MSWARNPSRSGWTATRASSSPAREPWWPSARSAATRASSALSRASPRRATAGGGPGGPGREGGGEGALGRAGRGPLRAAPRRRRERLVDQIGQGRAPPAPERLPQGGGGVGEALLGQGNPAPGHQGLEPEQ